MRAARAAGAGLRSGCYVERAERVLYVAEAERAGRRVGQSGAAAP